MQSHIALQLGSAIMETIMVSRLAYFGRRPIQYALAHLTTLPEGQILRQTFSSYLAYIELYEYALNEGIVINYTLTEPSVFMLFMFEGYSAFYDLPRNLISESRGDSFYMGYVNKGSYATEVKAGKSSLLLLTHSDYPAERSRCASNSYRYSRYYLYSTCGI